MPADRVFAGDDDQYFPDLGVWLGPGDPVPESAPDDPRFVAAGSVKSRKPAAAPSAETTEE